MIAQLTHRYTLLTNFFGVDTNLDPIELEKVLFYVEAIHMDHMPNLPYVLDDTLSEKDIIELLPILYKDTAYTFKPIYQKPEQEIITIDLFHIENSFQKYAPHLPEINEKYAIPNAALSLMKYYQSEVIATLKKEYVINQNEYSTVDEITLKYNHEANLLSKIINGDEILPEWELASFYRKDLTGMKFNETTEKEILT